LRWIFLLTKGIGEMDVTRRRFLTAASVTVLSMVAVSACAASAMSSPSDTHFAVTHTDAEWRRLLTAAQYSVLREAGTEDPYSSPLNNEHRHGVFSCAGCALHLYSSDTKFDSGTGWPSFWETLDNAPGRRDRGWPRPPDLRRIAFAVSAIAHDQRENES
jgi:peptide-methionine (R)-S-oxide reductase